MFQKSGYIASYIISEIVHLCSVFRKMSPLFREMHGNFKRFPPSYDNLCSEELNILEHFYWNLRRKHNIKTSVAVDVGIGMFYGNYIACCRLIYTFTRHPELPVFSVAAINLRFQTGMSIYAQVSDILFYLQMVFFSLFWPTDYHFRNKMAAPIRNKCYCFYRNLFLQNWNVLFLSKRASTSCKRFYENVKVKLLNLMTLRTRCYISHIFFFNRINWMYA